MARTAADQALALDPTSVLAHIELAEVLASQYDWPGWYRQNQVASELLGARSPERRRSFSKSLRTKRSAPRIWKARAISRLPTGPLDSRMKARIFSRVGKGRSGRLPAMALGAGGAPALTQAMAVLYNEFTTSLGLLGVTSLDQLGPEYVCDAPNTADPRVFSALSLLEDYAN